MSLYRDGDVHVVPSGDLVDHERTFECPCGPDRLWHDGALIAVHHSLDGREQDEEICG